MEPDRDLVFTPVNHPDPRVRQVGFDLNDTYVEQCWSAVVGPSATLLLRRLPQLWQHQVPAEVPAGEFSQSLGLVPPSIPTGQPLRARPPQATLEPGQNMVAVRMPARSASTRRRRW